VAAVRATPTLERAEPATRRACGEVLARAFLDDPAWRAIGPDRPGRRRRMLLAYFSSTLRLSARAGGRVSLARLDGRPAGVAMAFRSETLPSAVRAFAWQAPPIVIAGPAPAIRAAIVDERMRARHPHEPHVYLWFLAADPDLQGRGVGSALLAALLAEADEDGLPTYLETAKPDNLPFYARFGFAPVDECGLPRGARMWFLWRPNRPPSSRHGG
jgi:GNAT superfamily N-acetyltransferase